MTILIFLLTVAGAIGAYGTYYMTVKIYKMLTDKSQYEYGTDEDGNEFVIDYTEEKNLEQ